jgi:putative lipoprotein
MNLKLPRKLIASAALVLATAGIVGCSSKKAPDAVSTISGTLVYRDEVTLSPNAVAYVRLADVTDGQVNAATVLQEEVRPSGPLPIPFALVYKDKVIKPNRDYALEVRIVDQGKIQFISSEKQPVITHGHPSEVAMILERPGE